MKQFPFHARKGGRRTTFCLPSAGVKTATLRPDPNCLFGGMMRARSFREVLLKCGKKQQPAEKRAGPWFPPLSLNCLLSFPLLRPDGSVSKKNQCAAMYLPFKRALLLTKAYQNRRTATLPVPEWQNNRCFFFPFLPLPSCSPGSDPPEACR